MIETSPSSAVVATIDTSHNQATIVGSSGDVIANFLKGVSNVTFVNGNVNNNTTNIANHTINNTQAPADKERCDHVDSCLDELSAAVKNHEKKIDGLSTDFNHFTSKKAPRPNACNQDDLQDLPQALNDARFRIPKGGGNFASSVVSESGKGTGQVIITIVVIVNNIQVKTQSQLRNAVKTLSRSAGFADDDIGEANTTANC